MGRQQKVCNAHEMQGINFAISKKDMGNISEVLSLGNQGNEWGEVYKWGPKHEENPWTHIDNTSQGDN